MNNSELNQLLKSAKVPEPAADHWNEFPNRVSAALRLTRKSRTGQPRLWPRLAWGLSLAGACVLISFAIAHWRGAQTAQVAQNLLQSEKLIREVRTLFPNQVQSVILDEHGFRLVLAERADIPDSPPIYLNICSSDGCRQMITSSGQTVQIADQKVEVLADAAGGVMLVGDHFFWSTGENSSPEHLRIHAQQLNRVL